MSETFQQLFKVNAVKGRFLKQLISFKKLTCLHGSALVAAHGCRLGVSSMSLYLEKQRLGASAALVMLAF